MDVKSLCAELLEEQKSLKKRLQKVEENQKIENAKIKEELENLKNGGNRVADNSLFEIFVFDDYKYHAVEVRNSYLIRYVRVKVANLLNNDLVESFNLYYGLLKPIFITIFKTFQVVRSFRTIARLDLTILISLEKFI